MPSAKGRASVVELAGNVASEGEARFMLNAVGMASRIGTTKDPVVALDVAGQILAVRTRDHRTAVPAPVDYVAWTEQVKTFAQQKNFQGAHRRVLVTGFASVRAREGLQAAGWAVDEHRTR